MKQTKLINVNYQILTEQKGGRPENPAYSLLQGFTSAALFGKIFSRLWFSMWLMSSESSQYLNAYLQSKEL